jgi:hypothetical protein
LVVPCHYLLYFISISSITIILASCMMFYWETETYVYALCAKEQLLKGNTFNHYVLFLDHLFDCYRLGKEYVCNVRCYFWFQLSMFFDVRAQNVLFFFFISCVKVLCCLCESIFNIWASDVPYLLWRTVLHAHFCVKVMCCLCWSILSLLLYIISKFQCLIVLTGVYIRICDFFLKKSFIGFIVVIGRKECTLLGIMDDWIDWWITAPKGLHIYEPHD